MGNTTMQSNPTVRKQLGFTLIEIIIAIGIIGSATALVLYYQARAETSQKANAMAGDVAMVASKIKQYFGASNTYAGLTASALNQMNVMPKGFTWNGSDMIDPMGNTMSINGTASTFALTVGGSTGPLDREACASIASKLADNAQSIRVGAATAASGVISGGSVYKAVGGTPDAALLGTGCSAANPVIALQFR
jgi:prepilin-type N-terminal cleavage/methylation domain-containing protein